jgi:hypothetical protein
MSGFTCATCAEKVSVDTFAPWRCPNEKGDRHHVLLIDENDQHVVEVHHNPFIAFRRNMMWWQFAQARGMSDERRGFHKNSDVVSISPERPLIV